MEAEAKDSEAAQKEESQAGGYTPLPDTAGNDVADVQSSQPLARNVDPTDSTHKLVRRDDPPLYWAVAKNPTDDEGELNKIRAFLNETMANKGKFINEFKDDKGKVDGWAGMRFDEDGLKKAKGRDEFKFVVESPKIDRALVPPNMDVRRKKHAIKRAVDWHKISNPEHDFDGRKVRWYSDLVFDSVPKGEADPAKGEYVFPKEPGKGSIIYHIGADIEGGVSNGFDNGDEFPEDRMSIELTEKAQNDHAGRSESQADHDTCVVSKALGYRFGVAKNAHLVSVVMAEELDDMLKGFDKVAEVHSTKTAEEKERSLVLLTILVGIEGWDDQVVEYWKGKYVQAISKMHNIGIPVVWSAGNDDSNNFGKVDQMPVIWEGEDLPIIVVGATNFEGKRTPFSKGPEHVNVYAPGLDIYCQGTQEVEDKYRGTRQGTSMAAPQVAGVIATYMGLPDFPWGKDFSSPSDRVKAIKKYVMENASFKRKEGLPIEGYVDAIWNGAKVENHNGAQLLPGWPASQTEQPFEAPIPASAAWCEVNWDGDKGHVQIWGAHWENENKNVDKDLSEELSRLFMSCPIDWKFSFEKMGEGADMHEWTATLTAPGCCTESIEKAIKNKSNIDVKCKVNGNQPTAIAEFGKCPGSK